MFPPLAEGAFADRIFEDDGEAARIDDQSWSIDVTSGEARIAVGIRASSGCKAPQVILPAGERRRLVVRTAK